ncbi:MAG: hypothetical protein K2M17_03775, partial [Bacilli bacterium]|nr:hypothetical protein [Bacilli bacterium]
MIDLFTPTVKEKKVDTICFNFIIFDIFFLPLFPWFSASISLPIIVFWFLNNNKKLKKYKEYKYFSLVIILMVLSTCFSIIGFEGSTYNTTFITSLKRFFQYLTSFWYFFFFLYFFREYKRNIDNVVLGGILLIIFYAIIFSVNRDLFILLKQRLCPFDPQIERWFAGELLVFRYNFLWADPNNVAYATTSLVIFLLVESASLLKKYLAIACLLYILLCTMSIGGIVVAFCSLSYVIIFSRSLKKGKYSSVIGFLVVLLALSIIIYNIDFFLEIYKNGIIKRQETYGDSGISGGGGRWTDFTRGLGRLNPLFFIIGSGQEGFVTEIGHLYIICLYGLPVYIYFMYILFKKKIN